MGVFKLGKVYYVRFDWRGEPIKFSTFQGNKEAALVMEADHRTKLALGEVGIREKKPAPTLKDWLKNSFIPYVEKTHAEKPDTVRYYVGGSYSLLEFKTLAELPIDQITDEHAAAFIKWRTGVSPSTVNWALRTLRRALYVAHEWKRLPGKPDITLMKGERKRTATVSAGDEQKYLAACTGAWKCVATICLGTGMRPGEVFALRWENLNLGDSGVVEITKGKTDNARRELPMLEAVYNALQSHWEAAGEPAEGWVFPTRAKCGHMTTGKTAHKTALKKSGVKKFVPYTMRHTLLTTLGVAGTSVFALKKIAGHASVVTTERYIHPDQTTVNLAFEGLKKYRETQKVVLDSVLPAKRQKVALFKKSATS